MKEPAQDDKHQIHICEMMNRLGIEAGAGVVPRLSLRYVTALQRCQHCPSETACRDWLAQAAALVNLAPDFCPNKDILFELQFDQGGRVNPSSDPDAKKGDQ